MPAKATHGPQITSDQARQYQRDGALLIRNALSAAELELLEAGLEESRENPGSRFTRVNGADGRGETLVELLPSLDCPSLRALMQTGTLARLAGELMAAPSTQLVFDQVFYKQPGHVLPTPWHQDTPFLRVRGHDMARVWLCCDSSPADLTVQVVRGSHLWNVTYGTNPGGAKTVAIADEGRDFTYDGMQTQSAPQVPDVAGQKDSFDILRWDVEPGDALVLNANVLHGADGREHHPVPRRAFASIWGGPDVLNYSPQQHAVPSFAETMGHQVPHGARIGDYPQAYPIGWQR
jgi:ectoine hydroxylase-related dioxygenase (phytanoyl-CoA dioxygenase family)